MSENTIDFDPAFESLTGHAPFPWQRRLFRDRLSKGQLPPAIDIPTGLGKTAVMAIWLLARAGGAPLPRRLVYVVDRRAVVDQATRVAEDLRCNLCNLDRPDLDPVRRGLGLAGRPLPISTLRGQHVDNRDWLDDPAGPAIVVGTVDMIGSRLLFEGYGVSRRLRPFQAGLLGCDTLVLLDESHLARPFERLLQAIEKGRRPPSADDVGSDVGRFAGSRASTEVPPPFRVLPLSATLGSASGSGEPFTLRKGGEEGDPGDDDWADETVRQRLDASKTLTVEDAAPGSSIEDAMAERAWRLAQEMAEAPGQAIRTLIYCDKRTVAEKVADDLRRRAKEADSKPAVILFVGGRRVHEREEAAKELQDHGLIASSGNQRPDAPVFLVATSAGEVGVDLDADHMVCDLVAWERMVQRLGRVNRRGHGAARVLVIDQGPPEKKTAADDDIARRHLAARALLAELPPADSGRQAGPAALAKLGETASRRERIDAASTRMPLYPALTRPVVDAWSMTSLREHSGRPEVGPWLRGWGDDEPRTTVVWRRWLPVCSTGEHTEVLNDKAVEAFFEAAPVQSSERLESETWRVVDWLRKRARKLEKTLDGATREPDADASVVDDPDKSDAPARATCAAPLAWDAPVAFLFDDGGKSDDEPILTLREAASGLKTKDLERRLVGRLLVVDARLCGLRDGLLAADSGKPVTTIEDNWGRPEAWDEAMRNTADADGLPTVRVRALSDDDRNRLFGRSDSAQDDAEETSEPWRESAAERYRISSTDQTKTWLVVHQWCGRASSEDGKTLARTLQRLDAHQVRAAEKARRIAKALGLSDEDCTMLVAAARRHDDGKRVPRWQRAFNAPREGGPYAKTRGPVNQHVLSGYRHEFQSMLDAQKNGLDGVDSDDPRFDLALHMIAAHHGRARPAIGIDGCDRLPPTAAALRAREIGRRFARLQRQWGPWGLAWWEALLSAADQQASRELDEATEAKRRKSVANASPSMRATN